MLADCPRLVDVEQIAAELVADTVREGRWQNFVMVVSTKPGWVRVTIADDGPTDPRSTDRAYADQAPDAGEAAEAHAYGFQIINTLADRWGHAYPHSRHETLWAELDW